MREMSVYCSARDQDVRIVLTDAPTQEPQANIFDGEVVCLEIGEKCTGGLCPICAVSMDAMDARLARSGLREVHRKFKAHCDDCGRETEHLLSSGGYVTCKGCRSTARWFLG